MITRQKRNCRMPLSRRILKAITLFTGSESVSLFCSVIKMKLVALWLGAMGIGLFAIFNTTVDTLMLLTGLGIRQSAVKEVAAISNNTNRLAVLIMKIRSWSVLSGLIGATIISALAPLLSKWFFGDFSYWWQFMVLAAAMIMNSLTAGEQAILQGLSEFRQIAVSSVRASIAGLLLSIPLLRYCGDTGVMLSILAYSVSLLFFVMVSRNRRVAYSVSLPARKDGIATFVRLGGYISLSAFATNLAQFLFISWLSRNATVSDVGFYQAGNTIIFRYAGIILNAVGLEFYPRLSAVAGSRQRVSLFVSHEISLLCLVFTPLVLLFMIFKGFIVNLLYAPSFEVILPFIGIGIVSVLFRSYSIPIAYTMLAKGDGKTYFIVESLDAAIGLIINILFYNLWGLTGIGVALVCWTFFYVVIVSIVYFFKYRLQLVMKANLIAFICLIAIAVVVVLQIAG